MMSENCVREKTIEERIRDLANPQLTISGDEPDKIIQLISEEEQRLTEYYHQHIRKLEQENTQLKTEIKALAGYIQIKDL